ncbi:MAG: DUF4430 domain-containing protein [Alkalibacterium sp.]|uniref:DUF4430 domain-containing protein n=1 Tax=Alkalibacterium gilvum TaxID=1130080 RepID=UPI0026506E67|nr:DUF4430 domain-containing protein [Alkalibacterium sp.]MDN6294447.1 DUF4430 domain-containing protein [Alkalibacterium sp.]MDN6326833.1 DUF4430 domain-containing protein [Alkalibacterium sp.]MDN6385389.1 DUF4430 domain-containing protein [Alkalibacterium sp.]MDN6397749.1 DUF4430 domain-containing protein [Alkalibacterium sp.]
MQKKQKILITIVVGVILVAAGLWINGTLSNDSADLALPPDMKEVSITLYNQEEEISTDSFEVMNDTTLMEIMKDNYEMDVSDEGFVLAIDGYEQSKDDGLYWVFEANEEMVEVSTEDFVPENGDDVVWLLKTF